MERVTIYGTDLPQRRPIKEVISLQCRKPHERARTVTGGSSEGTAGNGDGAPWQCRQRRAFGSEARVLLSRGSSVACPCTRCRRQARFWVLSAEGPPAPQAEGA